MSFKTTFYLFLIVCLLGALSWMVVRHRRATEGQVGRDAPVLAKMDQDPSYLRLETRDYVVECAKKDGTWVMERPLKTGADGGAVDRLIAALQEMRRQEVITPVQRKARDLHMRDYGLTEPRLRFAIGDGATRQELVVGNEAPVGGTVYVKLASEGDVLATARAILDLIPKEVSALRDRRVLDGDAFRTHRLEIQRPGAGFVQFIFKDGQWTIHQPVLYRADAGKIVMMLEALYSLEVRKFVWDPPGASPAGTGTAAVETEKTLAGRAETCHLTTDQSSARIKVWVGGDDVGRELILGKASEEDAEGVYAKRKESDSIFIVNRRILDIFSVGLSDLKDRSVFAITPADVRYARFQKGDTKLVLARQPDRGWSLLEPVTWKADDEVVNNVIAGLTQIRVKAFVDTPVADLASLHLAPPAGVLELATEVPAPAPEAKAGPSPEAPAAAAPEPARNGAKLCRLLLGAKVATNDTVYAKFDGQDQVFQLSERAVANVGADPSDPRVFHDRTMLAVAAEVVKRIALTKDGREQAVSRDAAGKWTVNIGTGAVSQVAIDDVLFLVANFRASRIESLNPENPGAFGLQAPFASITLGLSGDEGIQKSIVVGGQTALGDRYAMVRGQDVVFVLDNGSVDRLTKDLLNPLPSKEAAVKSSPAP